MGAALSLLCSRKWRGILEREDPQGFKRVAK